MLWVLEIWVKMAPCQQLRTDKGKLSDPKPQTLEEGPPSSGHLE